MNYVFLILSVCLGSMKSVLSKASKTAERAGSDVFLNNGLIFVAAFFVTLLLCLADAGSAFLDVPFAVAGFFGLSTLAAQFFLIQATGCGPVALSTLIYSCGFLIPTVFGTVCYREPMHPLYGIGAALVLLSFLLIVGRGKGKRANGKWLFYSLGGMFFSGVVGIIQKVFIKECPSASPQGFLAVAFALIAAASFVMYAAVRVGGSPAPRIVKRGGREPALQQLLGLIVGGQNLVNLYLVGALPSAVSFPVMNGGVILMTTVVSALVYREKLTVRQIVAVFIGVAAIVCIGLGKMFVG